MRTKLDTVSRIRAALADLEAHGFDPNLTEESYDSIADCGFQTRTLPIAIAAASIALEEKPITLRGLFYRVVSAGLMPSTDQCHYAALGRIMTKLREEGVVPFKWIVDSIRSTLKPSSWSGLEDFADTVRDAYRRDFWAELPGYAHVIVEKDAMAGVLQPVTAEYDVPLSVVRGYVSLSFAHEIASTWAQIEKPINAYYLGDFDPSGLQLEDDLRDKLARYSGRKFRWTRLGVVKSDFDAFDLIRLDPKPSDRRTAGFLRAGHSHGAELDAIPATALRDRLERAIAKHIPAEQWDRLRQIERLERDRWHETMAAFRSDGGAT